MATAWTARASEAPKPRPPEIERARAEPAVVRVQGDTIYYTGNFSKASAAAFDAAVAGVRRGQLTRLVISSGGGDTVEGRHVGHTLNLRIKPEDRGLIDRAALDGVLATVRSAILILQPHWLPRSSVGARPDAPASPVRGHRRTAGAV